MAIIQKSGAPRLRAFAPSIRTLRRASFALLLSWLSMAVAQEIGGAPSEFRQTHWGTRDGAPLFSNTLAQTIDGSLWLGSQVGLYRFDALRFEHLEIPNQPEFSSAPISRLYATPDGGLWIGYSLGGAVFMRDGHFQTYDERDGLPGGNVRSFWETADGTVWAATARGLARKQGDRWQAVDATWNWPGGGANNLLTDSTGRLWIVTPDGVLSLPAGSRTFSPLERIEGQYGRQNIAESRDGSVWLLHDDGARRLAINPPTGKPRVSSNGWAALDAGDVLWRINLGHEGRRVKRSTIPTRTAPGTLAYAQFEETTSIAVTGVSALLADREGNLWLSDGSGITRIGPRQILQIQSKPGWRPAMDPSLTALAAGEGGKLLLGSYVVQQVFSFDGTETTPLPIDLDFTCMSASRAGSVWLGGRDALWHVQANHGTKVDLPADLRSEDIQSMFEDDEGALWISFPRRGVYRYQVGVWREAGTIASLPLSLALVISGDARGRVWFGYQDGRVAVLDRGDVRVFGREQGLRVGHVFAIYGKRNAVWIGGDAGLARFDGQAIHTLAAEGGPVLRSIAGLVETRSGDLWLNGGAGVARIPAVELARAAADPNHAVAAEVFDASQGIEGSGFRIRLLPSLIEGGDERLWAATSVDIYGIDPVHLVRSPKPPALSIQSLAVDGRPYATTASQTLPERASALRFTYEGLSLSAAEQVRYRYRIDGIDKDWQSAQGRREAYYMNLGPGRYRFRVQATFAGLPWPPTESSLEFTIPPTFFQTNLFFGLCVFAAAAAIWAFIQWRVRRLALALRFRHEAQLVERERIARELHDTLLQGTQGLLLSVHGAAKQIDPAHPSKTLLAAAVVHGEALLVEGRDRIQDLRMNANLSDSLTASIREVGSELQRLGGSCRFEVDVEGAPRDLAPGAHEEVYRIAREAILNAFQHADADVIGVQLVYGPNAFRLCIRDDGRGIDEAVSIEHGVHGHWGFRGMQERARHIGGQLDIQSRPGAGTQLALSVPAAQAYRHEMKTPRWSTLLASARRLAHRR